MVDRPNLKVALVGASILREAELPGFEDVTDFASECYNLAIASLKTVVAADPALAPHVDVQLLDFPVSWDCKELGVRESEVVVAARPDVVGLSCYCWSLDTLLALGARVKAALPDALLLLGGPSAGPVGADLMAEHPWIGAVARGEGEDTFRALLRARLDGRSLADVPGLTWRAPDGAAVDNDFPPEPVDVRTLPSPYRTGIMAPPGRSLFVETSRGCRFRCRFCSWMGAGRSLRYRPLDEVEADLRWAVAHGYTSLKLADTAINFHTERVRDLMDAIRRADPARTMRFTYFLKLELLDEAQAEVLRGIPTEEIILGVESLNDEARRAVGKPPFDPAEFARKVELLRPVGPVTVSLMLGLPGDTVEGLLRTVDWFVEFDREHPDLVYLTYIFWLAVLPGASFHYDRAQHGFRVMPTGTPYFLESRDFGPDALLQAARRSVERHYAHPKLRVEYFQKEYLLQDLPAPERHSVVPRWPDDPRPVALLVGALPAAPESHDGDRPYSSEIAWMKAFAEADDAVRHGHRIELLHVPEGPLSAGTLALVASYRPALVVWTTGAPEGAAAALTALRAALPDTPLALAPSGPTAPAATGDAALLATLAAVDAVLPGEAEVALRAILAAGGRLAGVPGVATRAEGPARSPSPLLADLDAIPSPFQWGFVERTGETIRLRLGRPPAGGLPARVHGPARIAADVRWAIEQRHRHVVWSDPSLPADPERLRAFVAAVRQGDPEGLLVHSYALGGEALGEEALAALLALPTREVRVAPYGELARPVAEALRGLAERWRERGARIVRAGPDPWLAPARIAALLLPWRVGMALEGWTLAALGELAPGPGVRVVFTSANGARAEAHVTRAAAGGPSHYALRLAPTADVPTAALARLAQLATAALARGERLAVDKARRTR